MERGAAKLAKLRLARTDAAPFPAPCTNVTARSTGFKSNDNFNNNRNRNRNGNCNRNCNCNCNCNCNATQRNATALRADTHHPAAAPVQSFPNSSPNSLPRADAACSAFTMESFTPAASIDVSAA